MQEILVLIVIALAIFYLPRVIGRKSAPVREVRRPALTGWMRLAILMTVFWIAGSAAILKPWQDDVLPFFYTGLAPVAALWGSTWVWFGYRKNRR
jgi:hypothetical protein